MGLIGSGWSISLPWSFNCRDSGRSTFLARPTLLGLIIHG